MVWKKNAFSLGMWLFYLMGVSILFGYGAMKIAEHFGWNSPYMAGLTAGIQIIVLFLLFVVLRKCTPRMHFFYQESQAGLVLESLLVVALFAAGLVIRIVHLTDGAENMAYFEAAKVEEGMGLPQITHGGAYFYLQMLRWLFLLVGNRWMAGIWLQIGLQLIGGILLFLGVRSIGGRIPAVIAVSFFLLSPGSISEGLLYSPKMLYLCFYGGGLICLGLFLSKYVKAEKERTSHRIRCFILGLLPGLVCYLDITGITLLLAAISVLFLQKEGAHIKSGLVNLLLYLAGGVGAFFGCLALDAFACGKGAGGILSAWLRLYGTMEVNNTFWIPENGKSPAYYLLILLLMLGVFSYWCRRKKEQLSIWIIMCMGIAVPEFLGMTTEYMSGMYLFYYLLAVMAGIGLAQCFIHEPDKVKISAPIETKEEEAVEEETIKYIENPLPLPKKHVKKTMDYQLEPEEKQMDFDLEIPDYDDFDIT